MYTIEGKDLQQQGVTWYPIEGNIAIPQLADVVARTLALQSRGRAAFRVRDNTGNVIVEVQVKEYLQVSKPQSSVPLLLEEIPPHFSPPILVLSNGEERARVFPTARRSEQKTRDLVSTLTLLASCLIDWLELDEGCTCDASSPQNLCLTCSSHQAVMQANRWLQQLAPDQVSDGLECKILH